MRFASALIAIMTLVPNPAADAQQQVKTAAPAPVPPLPSPQQLAWADLETYAFVHFGPNTFTNVEWGEGRENPKVFNPTNLDCRQWAEVCRDAGLKAIIITAKHHDGFCLWPSKHTEHSVKNSPLREGKGDVLKELSEACREYGLKFGVYLSPWDRNNPLYGSGQAYNEYFASQLREVLTSYGEVFEVWFDGACGEGPNGKRQTYDWPLFIRTVRECQPNAVVFSDAGPDVRWVGNERGYAGETNWSMLKRDAFWPGIPNKEGELNEGDIDGTHWLPAECDVSIRPGWFYHPEQDDKVKSVDDLVKIYLGSVGRNGNLLLNLPVDRRGLVHENDAAALRAWRAELDRMFKMDLLRTNRDVTIAASNERQHHGAWFAGNVFDGDNGTFWGCDDDVVTVWIEITFGAPRSINCVTLQEPIKHGQRIKAFVVEVLGADGEWKQVARGTTVGHRRILRFDRIATTRLRIRIFDSRAAPLLSTVSAYDIQ